MPARLIALIVTLPTFAVGMVVGYVITLTF